MHEAIYNSQLNLSDIYPSHLFKNLVRVFPRINNIVQKNNTNKQPVLIEKFLFYQMILEKIKNYFELSESFVISESIDIILKDIKNKKKITLNKTAFPLIEKYKIATTTKFNTRDSKSPGNLKKNEIITKKIPSPSSSPPNNFINSKNSNPTSVNHIYLNLNKGRDSKMKLTRLAEGNAENNNKIIKKIMEKEFYKKSNFKISNTEKKVLNYTSNFKNGSKDLSENKKHLIMTAIENSFVNKSSIGMKKSETENQINVNEKLININNNRNIAEIYQKNLKAFINIDDKNFDIFDFEEKVGKENTLVLVSKYIFNYFNFGEIINQNKYDNWCDRIAKGYKRTNFYHHDLHAADITHTSYIYFKFGLIHEIAKLDNSMICAVILSCICHDYKHPGVNNNYLIDTNNNIALTYNDISVLESMHVSEAFKLMFQDNNCNLFEGFDREKYKTFRKQMIQCVLSTDMSKHSLSINFLKKCLNENNKPEDNDKQDYMDLVIHTADISNPTKVFDIYFKWAKLVVEEFYDQGDKEKKLGLKCSCDRYKVTLYKNQLGFIDFIELPFFSLVVKVFPKLDFLFENLNNNKQKILKLEEENNKKQNEIEN